MQATRQKKEERALEPGYDLLEIEACLICHRGTTSTPSQVSRTETLVGEAASTLATGTLKDSPMEGEGLAVSSQCGGPTRGPHCLFASLMTNPATSLMTAPT